MITEDQKREIEESVMISFEKYSYLQYRDLYAKVMNGQKVDDGFIIGDRLLQRRALDIDFYIYVLGQRSADKAVAKHRKIIVRSAIISLARGTFTLSDADRDKGDHDYGDPDADGSYTDRHVQRIIHEKYKSAFFENGPAPKSPGDGRIKRISSVFSEEMPPSDPAGDLASGLMSAARSTSDDHSELLFLNSVARFAFPQFLGDLLKFRDECRAVFESLGELDERIAYLREQLTVATPMLITLYSHITSVLDLTWFRYKPKDIQKRILGSYQLARYNQADSTKVKEMLDCIYGPNESVGMLCYAATAFIKYGRTKQAIHMFKLCLDSSKGDLKRGMLLQNIAVAHRIDGNFKLALGAMKEALLHFEAAGDTYRICNAMQLIGESQWRLGFKDAAMQSFDKCEERGQAMDPEKRWLIHFILGMSFGRLEGWKIRRKHLVKAMELMPEENTADILWINQLIDDQRPMYSDTTLPVMLRNDIRDHMRQLSTLSDRIGSRGTS